VLPCIISVTKKSSVNSQQHSSWHVVQQIVKMTTKSQLSDMRTRVTVVNGTQWDRRSWWVMMLLEVVKQFSEITFVRIKTFFHFTRQCSRWQTHTSLAQTDIKTNTSKPMYNCHNRWNVTQVSHYVDEKPVLKFAQMCPHTIRKCANFLWNRKRFLQQMLKTSEKSNFKTPTILTDKTARHWSTVLTTEQIIQ